MEYLISNHIILFREPLMVLTNNLSRALTLDVLSGSWVTNINYDSSTLDSDAVVLYQHIPFALIHILKTFHQNYRIFVTSNKSTFFKSLLRHEQIIELLPVHINFKYIDRHSCVSFLTDVTHRDSCDRLHTIYSLQYCLSWVESSCLWIGGCIWLSPLPLRNLQWLQ